MKKTKSEIAKINDNINKKNDTFSILWDLKYDSYVKIHRVGPKKTENRHLLDT